MIDAVLESINIPEKFIAQRPLKNRPEAKLLVYFRKSKQIIDDKFINIDKYLPNDVTIVFNNTKVEKCRILLSSDLLNVELFILDKIDDFTAWCMVKPGKKIKVGMSFNFNDVEIEILDINEFGHRLVLFNIRLDSKELAKYRHVPLPPYIKQNEELEDEYQTVFASVGGSKAAPTASLHFDANLMSKLEDKFRIAFVSLNVGLGTFANLNELNFMENKLHTERYQITRENMEIVNKAKIICAVGTTSLRVLESAAIWENNKYKVIEGVNETDIFIRPGYKFKMVECLVTNFHLPGTSLLYLVSAFIGSSEEVARIYQHALDRNYRFFSFGDGMVII